MKLLIIGAGGVGTSAAKIIARQGKEADWAEKIVVADYDAAREHQAQVEARIRELEALIKNSEIIEESDGKKKAAKNAVVKLGSVVTLKDLSDNVESTFSIVGSIEADPLNGKLSNNTPLAEAILDHKVGDVVTVSRVDEPYDVEITKIA